MQQDYLVLEIIIFILVIKFIKLFKSSLLHFFFLIVGNDNSTNSNDDLDSDRKKKKKSRWGGGDHDKTFIPGMPTILPSTLSPHQQEAYLGKF